MISGPTVEVLLVEILLVEILLVEILLVEVLLVEILLVEIVLCSAGRVGGSKDVDHLGVPVDRAGKHCFSMWPCSAETEKLLDKL